MGDYRSMGVEIAEFAAWLDADDANSADAAEGGNSTGPEAFAGRYDDLAGLFGAFDNCPSRGDFDGLLAGADQLVNKLSSGEKPDDEYDEGLSDFANPALDHFDIVDGYVEDWQGQAAVAFHEQFLSHSQTYTQNQYLMATVLRGALRCEQELWDNAKKSVEDIAKGTMDGLEDYRQGKPGKADFSFAIGVIGTVIGAVGSGGIGLLAAATGIFSSALGQDVSGDTPERIVQQARDGIQKVKDDLATEESKMIEILEANRSYLTSNREAEFTGKPGAWDLIDADPSNASKPGVIGNER